MEDEIKKVKTALVTGASSGIGEAIALRLLEAGYIVYGIGRDFSHCVISEVFTSEHWHPVVCDLSNYSALLSTISALDLKHRLSLLVNNAGVGFFAPHEELSPRAIHEMVAVNLEAPLLLTNLLLRDIKENEGTILNISSVTAKQSNTYGCAYGATKAGLTSFANSLFEECRRYGVRVITLHPDMTASNFYRNTNFKEAPESNCHLEPEEIADAALLALNERSGLCVTDITLRPQKHRLERKPNKKTQ